jgi:saccharopine dehydrogenase (NAD+, L-lysine-forming)
VRDLEASDEVEELLLLDLDEARAQDVATTHGGAKASAARTDARAPSSDPGSLARAIEGWDVLVNSASYRVNLDAMAGCLHAGCHYLDLGGLYWMTTLQLDLDLQFRRQGLLALLGIGSAPGKTNLMARVAVDALSSDEAAADGAAPPIDSVNVCAAGRDLDPPPGFSVPYALQTLLDELTMKPIVLRDGHPREVEPLSDGGEVDFGEPIGTGRTIYTIHSELRTFGDSFGCREASFRLCLSPELLAELRALTTASETEVRQRADEVQPPSERTVSVHSVEAASGGRQARVRAVTEPMGEWGLGGGIVSTAAPAAAAVRLLARGVIDARGSLPPERCIDPRAMFTELERHGCRFEITAPQEVRA